MAGDPIWHVISCSVWGDFYELIHPLYFTLQTTHHMKVVQGHNSYNTGLVMKTSSSSPDRGKPQTSSWHLCASVTQQCNLVLAMQQRCCVDWKVITDLVECNTPHEWLKKSTAIWMSGFSCRINSWYRIWATFTLYHIIWPISTEQSAYCTMIYTVSGKKKATLFSTTTLAFLGRFL